MPLKITILTQIIIRFETQQENRETNVVQTIFKLRSAHIQALRFKCHGD